MTEKDAGVDRSALVPGVHRLVRSVADTEGPFAGTLVTLDEGVAVSVPVTELADWAGWAYSGSEHVCGVLDVRRRTDGHDALVPWCTQRVEAFLGRRRAAEEPLTPGEMGTLMASLLRGLRELGEDTSKTIGEWWLTGQGRPLFVHGEGGPARARTLALVERITPHAVDRAAARIVEEVAAALREHRHHRDDDARWEAQLFAMAAPRALRTDVFAPAKVVDLVSRRSLRVGAADVDQPRHRVRTAGEREDRWAPFQAALVHVRERWHQLTVGLRRAEPQTPRSGQQGEGGAAGSRRRPLILAASLAVVVLVAGMMWPDGQDEEAADATTMGSPAAQQNETPVTPAPDSEHPAPESAPNQDEPDDAGDVLGALDALLTVIESCVAESEAPCPALSEGVELPTEGLVVRGPSASDAHLVDDYGDVAVVKLSADQESADAVAQMLVLERREQKWLVRDVYDVAHQPE